MTEDHEIEELRDEALRIALRTSIAAMENEDAPWTARIQAARGVLADATARRHDDYLDELEPHRMSSAQIEAKIAETRLRLVALNATAASAGAVDAEFEEVAPADRSVFD